MGRLTFEFAALGVSDAGSCRVDVISTSLCNEPSLSIDRSLVLVEDLVQRIRP